MRHTNSRLTHAAEHASRELLAAQRHMMAAESAIVDGDDARARFHAWRARLWFAETMRAANGPGSPYWVDRCQFNIDGEYRCHHAATRAVRYRDDMYRECVELLCDPCARSKRRQLLRELLAASTVIGSDDCGCPVSLAPWARGNPGDVATAHTSECREADRSEYAPEPFTVLTLADERLAVAA